MCHSHGKFNAFHDADHMKMADPLPINPGHVCSLLRWCIASVPRALATRRRLRTPPHAHTAARLRTHPASAHTTLRAHTRNPPRASSVHITRRVVRSTLVPLRKTTSHEV